MYIMHEMTTIFVNSMQVCSKTLDLGCTTFSLTWEVSRSSTAFQWVAVPALFCSSAIGRNKHRQKTIRDLLTEVYQRRFFNRLLARVYVSMQYIIMQNTDWIQRNMLVSLDLVYAESSLHAALVLCFPPYIECRLDTTKHSSVSLDRV
jgi:hypothetical protein